MSRFIETLVLRLAPYARTFGLATTHECWEEYQRADRMARRAAARRARSAAKRAGSQASFR